MKGMEIDPATGLWSLGADGTAPPGRFEAAARLIESVVAPAFGLRQKSLRVGGRGCAEVAFARQVAMYLAHTRLGLSYAKAGTCFGRDRTTARHACRRVEERREDVRLDTLLDCLERSIDLMPHEGGAARRAA